MSTFYLIDANHMLHRAYHAAPPLTNTHGAPTGALMTFGSMLWALLAQHNPKYVGAIFDPPGGSFRSELYPAYKGERRETPSDLALQFPFFPEITEGLGIKTMSVSGFEADDLIGTLARQCVEQGHNVVIVTGDKDMMQLISGNVSVLDTMKGKIVQRADVIKKFGVGPELVADALALAGDSSDNIPGVPGIGAKTAAALLEQFGSLEGVLNNVDKISGAKRKQNLTEHADNARLYRALTGIKTGVPVRMLLREWLWKGPDQLRLLPLLDRLELRALRSRIDDYLKAKALISKQQLPTSLEDFF